MRSTASKDLLTKCLLLIPDLLIKPRKLHRDLWMSLVKDAVRLLILFGWMTLVLHAMRVFRMQPAIGFWCLTPMKRFRMLIMNGFAPRFERQKQKVFLGFRLFKEIISMMPASVFFNLRMAIDMSNQNRFWAGMQIR